MRPFILLAPFAMLAACNHGGTAESNAQGSGIAGNRAFPLADFDRVALRGPDDVIVRVGPAFSVNAAGDTGLIDELEIAVERGTLKVGRKSRNGFNWRNSGGRKVTVTVTLPALRGASVAGSGDMTVDKVADAFAASVAGSGTMKVAQVAAPKVDLDIAGSGEAELTGAAQTVSISVAGSGSAKAKGLKARDLSVSVAGSGDVEAAADATADISVMGSGNVDIFGPAHCKTSKLGSGSVRCNAT